MRSLSLLLALTFAAPAVAIPLQLNHQGRLDDATGVPLEGQHSLTVRVYDQAAGGTELWSDTVNASFEGGVYSIILGADGSNPLPAEVFDGSVRYVALAVNDGAELPQRLVLTSVPYAMRAGVAASVAGGVVDASELRIGGNTVIGADGQVRAPVSYDDLIDVPDDADTLGDLACASGQIAQWNGLEWACADQAPATVDVGTLSGTVSITNLPVGGGADQVAAGDHAHAFGEITGVAAIGQLPTGIDNNSVALGDHGHNLVDLSGDLPLTRTTGDLPLTRTTGDLPLTRTTGDLPLTRTTGDLPLTRTTGDLPLTRTTGDLPITRTTGDLPLARTTGDLPITRTTGSLDAARLSGTVAMAQLPVGSTSASVSRGDHSHNFNALTGSVGFAQLPTGTTSSTVAVGNHGHAFSAISGTAALSQLPVGTSSTTVARGDHTHDAGAIVSGTIPTARLDVGTGSGQVAAGNHDHSVFGGGIKIGNDSATCNTSKAGTIRYSGSALEFCNGSAWQAIPVGSSNLCPSDMADAGGFCIDINDNAATDWQSQAVRCQQEGKRMCSLAEWSSACVARTSLGLNNMLDGNFEYVDEYWVMNYTNGNYYSSFVSAGATSCSRVYYSGWACANSSCYDTTSAGGGYQSRCCK